MKTNGGLDHISRAVGGDVVGVTGTATATSATTLTDSGAAFPTAGSGYTGHFVVAASNVYGVVVSNTATVLTIDYWHTPGAPGTVASTPSGTAVYTILPGGAPAWYLALTANSNAPSATDTMLATTAGGTTNAEIWNASGGLNRVKAAYAHTNGTATYTISNTFTANSNDGASNVINKIGIFAQGVTAVPTSSTAGTLLYTTAVSSPPTLISGDTLLLTDTISLS